MHFRFNELARLLTAENRQIANSASMRFSMASLIADEAVAKLCSSSTTTSTAGPAPLRAAPKMPCSPTSGSSIGNKGQMGAR